MSLNRMSSVLLRLLRQSFLNLTHIISEQKIDFQFVPISAGRKYSCEKNIVQKTTKHTIS
jgi:hypothetical protein